MSLFRLLRRDNDLNILVVSLAWRCICCFHTPITLVQEHKHINDINAVKLTRAN